MRVQYFNKLIQKCLVFILVWAFIKYFKILIFLIENNIEYENLETNDELNDLLKQGGLQIENSDWRFKEMQHQLFAAKNEFEMEKGLLRQKNRQSWIYSFRIKTARNELSKRTKRSKIYLS